MKGPTYIDLFCGAGGLSTGLARAGWHCRLATDWWPDALRTHVHNAPSATVWDGDIHSLRGSKLNELAKGSPDWVVGGPPCQGFSTVGKRSREDERNGLFREFFRVVKTLKPRGFLIENVLGLKDMRFGESVVELFESIGYTVAMHVVTAAEHGVPQLRRRVIFVGDIDGRWFLGPKAQRTPEQYVTVRDAIGDLPQLRPGETSTNYSQPPKTAYQREMRRGSKTIQGHAASAHPPSLVEAISFIPDGGNRFSIPDRYQPKSGFHNSYSRLSSNEPAVAVTQNMGKPSGTRCIHPTQHRGLTTREGARLQSFPDTYHFLGGVTSQRLQVANAVPPLLAEAIGRALLDSDRWLKSAPAEGTQQPLKQAEGEKYELPRSRGLAFKL